MHLKLEALELLEFGLRQIQIVDILSTGYNSNSRPLPDIVTFRAIQLSCLAQGGTSVLTPMRNLLVICSSALFFPLFKENFETGKDAQTQPFHTTEPYKLNSERCVRCQDSQREADTMSPTSSPELKQ